MSSVDKIQCLCQYRWLELDIQRLTAQIDSWRARMAYLGSGVPKNSLNVTTNEPDGNTVNCIAKVIDLQRKLEIKLQKQLQLKAQAEELVESLKDPRERLLLRYRYMLGMRWEEIAVTMHYGYRWVLRLHQRALSKLK